MRGIILRAWLGLFLLPGGCATLRELPPETAASRLASSSGLQEQACLVMQSYADYLSAMDWNAPQPLERKPSDEVAHYRSVFNLGPEISCTVLISLKSYELNAKRFAQLLDVFQPLEDVYGTLDGKSLLECEGCELPDISNTNTLLKDYFMREPFQAKRKQHTRQFQDVCLDGDQLAENRETIASHNRHFWQPGMMNPLHPSHAGCADVWREALQVDKHKCSRYPESPRYLICPTIIWDTEGKVSDAKTTMPFSRFTEGVNENIPFSGGFILDLPGIFDVYWQPETGLLQHLRLPPVKAKEKPVFKDYDSNGLNDVSLGGMLFLANDDGTAQAISMVDFKRIQERKREEELNQRNDVERRRSTEGISLFEMEDQLSRSATGDKVLPTRAAARAEEWWLEVSDANSALSEKVRVYWHLLLWARVSTGKNPHAEFMLETLDAARLDKLDARMKEIEKFYRKGDVNTVARQCATLNEEYAATTSVIAGLAAGAEAAEAELGELWPRYLRTPFPAAEGKGPAKIYASQKSILDKRISAWCK